MDVEKEWINKDANTLRNGELRRSNSHSNFNTNLKSGYNDNASN